MTRTRPAGQPNSPARAVSPYCSRVDSWCSSTCWGVDCRTYTTASRSWWQGWTFLGEPPSAQGALVHTGGCDLDARGRALMTPLLPWRGRVAELPLHHLAEQREHLPAGGGRQLVPERADRRYLGWGGARSTDRLGMGHAHFPQAGAGLPARPSPARRVAAAHLVQSWAGRLRLSMFEGEYGWRSEHTSRFLKQMLNWTVPRVRQPEQADHWTWLVVLAYTQLRLARPLVGDQPLPWQRPQPAGKLTPSRVQRAFSTLRFDAPVRRSGHGCRSWCTRRNPVDAPPDVPKASAPVARRVIRPSPKLASAPRKSLKAGPYSFPHSPATALLARPLMVKSQARVPWRPKGGGNG
jgi:hypothetical protein